MALGRKTGGRQKGTRNNRTVQIEELLAELKCDPIQGMAKIAMDCSLAPELRGRMYAELAGYLYPKRKATEIKLDEGPRVTFHISTGITKAINDSGATST
jgi:hypothetical protein